MPIFEGDETRSELSYVRTASVRQRDYESSVGWVKHLPFAGFQAARKSEFTPNVQQSKSVYCFRLGDDRT